MAMKKTVDTKTKEIVVTTRNDVEKAIGENPDMKWFVLSTYSGKDAAAKRSIEERLITCNSEDKVGLVLMAEKKVSELRGGTMKLVKKKLYPGYLLILAKVQDCGKLLDTDVYQAVNGGANINEFVDQSVGSMPKCVRNKKEIDRILEQLQTSEEIDTSLEISEGDEVNIVSGSFAGFTGFINSIDKKKGSVSVDIRMFGSISKVDMQMNTVQKLES